jgi:tetratricopeptide (TPR) repeat protein
MNNMFMRMCITGVLLAVCSILSAQSADEYIKAAKEKEKEKNYTEALKIYSSAITKHADTVKLYLSRAYVYTMLGKGDEALADYEMALEKDGEYYDAYFQRGRFWMLIKQPDKAIADFSKALKYGREDSLKFNCYWNRAGAKVFKRDFDRGLEDFYRAYAIDSNHIGLMNDMAAALDEVGKGQEMIALLLRTLQVDSNFAPAYVNLGFKYSLMEEYEKSIEMFNKAIMITPGEPYVYNNRGYSKLKMGDTKGALKDINKSLDLDPTNSYAYRNKALVYIAMNKTKDACKEIEKAIEKGFTMQYGREMEELKYKNCKQ